MFCPLHLELNSSTTLQILNSFFSLLSLISPEFLLSDLKKQWWPIQIWIIESVMDRFGGDGPSSWRPVSSCPVPLWLFSTTKLNLKLLSLKTFITDSYPNSRSKFIRNSRRTPARPRPRAEGWDRGTAGSSIRWVREATIGWFLPQRKVEPLLYTQFLQFSCFNSSWFRSNRITCTIDPMTHPLK